MTRMDCQLYLAVKVLILALIVAALTIVRCNASFGGRFPEHMSPEGVLISNLMTAYHKRGTYGRPIFNYTKAVPVQFQLQLIQIMDLSEKDQVFKINVWTNYLWKDEFLTWNPDDYEGVNEIRLPSHKIWTPDIRLYNYADIRLEEKRDARCIVAYDGNVTWIPQAIYMSSCNIDVTTFPFDKQNCSLKFGSWTHDGTKLDLDFLGAPKIKTDDYFVENNAWKILETAATRNVFKYDCCPEVYIDLTYYVIFRRSATFYTYILIMPCVLLTSLTLVLYWIPPESPTKMSLDIRLEEKRDARCIVAYDGNVTWIPQAIYMSSCNIDVTTFPFDKQNCSLKFGSWTHDGTKLNLDFLGEPKIKTDDYFVENNAWKILHTSAERNVFKYACCPEVYIDLTYFVIFRRSATFYTYILILPCVLLTSLTLVLYWIPPESPTKMALGMSIFMAFFVLLLIFEVNMPPASRMPIMGMNIFMAFFVLLLIFEANTTASGSVPILGMSIFMAFFVLLLLFEANMPPASSNIPILGTYYCLNMMLITLSTFLNVFVVNLSFYGARAPVPKMLRTVMFQFFARMLCMDNLVRPFLEADKKRLIPPAIPGMGFINGDSKWTNKNWKGSSELLTGKNFEIEIDPQWAEIDTKLTEIRDFLFIYKERIEEKDKKEKIAKEWKAVGLIFDRIFFTVYLVTIVVSLSVVLPVIFMST